MWESWPWRCGKFCRADYVNLGYRGVDADNSRGTIKHCGKYKTLTATERKLLKRRQSGKFTDKDKIRLKELVDQLRAAAASGFSSSSFWM